MAYQTSTSTSIDNLMSQLFSFAVSNGWTQDDFTSGDPGSASLHKNGVYVHFQWTDGTDGGTLAIYHSLGYVNSGTSKWLHTDDSNVGVNSAVPSNFDNERCVNILAGPHTAYHFFENDSNPAYIHVVVEVDAGRFRHFGFGELDKIGDWTGGEYAYGHYWSQSTSTIDAPNSASHGVGLDSVINNTSRGATVHVEDLVGEPDASTKWLVVSSLSSAGVDTAGVARYPGYGGWRANPYATGLSRIRISENNAFKPLIPIPCFAVDYLSAPDAWRLLGFQPDVALINIGNLQPGDEFTVGTDTWVVFPLVRKQYTLGDVEESWNAGYAYRKVIA